MKALLLLSLSFAVALGMPVLPAGLAENPVLTKEEQSPLLGDLVPLQGHVEVEEPAPQPGLTPEEQLQQQSLAKNVVEEEVKVEPAVEGQKEQQAEAEVKVVEAEQPVVEAEPQVEAEAKPEVEAEQQTEVEAEQPVVEAEQPVVEAEPQPEVEAEAKPEVEAEQPEVEAQPPAAEVEVEEQSGTDFTEIEKSMRVAFLGPNPVDDPPQEEEEEEEEDPSVDVQPEIIQRSLGNPPDDSFVNEYDPWPDQEWFPDYEVGVAPTYEPMGDFPTQDEANFLAMWEKGNIFADVGSSGEEDYPVEDYPDYGAQVGLKRKRRALMGEGSQSQPGQGDEGPRSCPGVALDGKCYQFFKEPKRAADAEFFCQAQFPGGHLASITSQRIHRELMALMQKENGAYTRTWVGGLRFLDTGRFVWLDGSHWDYADWLSGEPNNTAGVEDCLEILPSGNGKFNDFTCWEPQAFICSYVL